MVKELFLVLEKPNLNVSKISKGLVLVVIFLWVFSLPSQIFTELETHPDLQIVLILQCFMFS